MALVARHAGRVLVCLYFINMVRQRISACRVSTRSSARA
jgi:hypothetical protein